MHRSELIDKGGDGFICFCRRIHLKLASSVKAAVSESQQACALLPLVDTSTFEYHLSLLAISGSEVTCRLVECCHPSTADTSRHCFDVITRFPTRVIRF